jgi:hypothetical protein
VISFTSLTFNPEEAASGTRCTGGCVGRRAGLAVMKRKLLPLLGFESRLLGRPARGAVAILTEVSPILSVDERVMSLEHSLE